MRRLRIGFSLIMIDILLVTCISCGTIHNDQSDIVEETEFKQSTETPKTLEDNKESNKEECVDDVDDATREVLVNNDIDLEYIKTLPNGSLGWGPGINFD